MNAPAERPHGLSLLREPFEPHLIGKLPKPLRKDAQKGHCDECGGYHGLPAIHLDYVGHAALTHRLLDADPNWTWEPLSVGPEGLPMLDDFGGLWIKLTVCGVTRLGYGDAGNKSGADAIKETIGDALRNAAMRFGAALDLWHKGDLHPRTEADDEDRRRPAHSKGNERIPTTAQRIADEIIEAIQADLELRVVEKYTAACDDSERLADAVWARLSKRERDYVTEALNKAGGR